MLEQPHARGPYQGRDGICLLGTFFDRTYQGTFTLGSNCRGGGSNTDSLGQTVTFVMTAVNGGDTLFLQGDDPGTAIHGVAQRVRR